jgi:hypothetical protein|tara:strand:+ start:281 stop:514 length:234 start_codon:yes stop_codon:yes gene_type:complete
MSETETIEIPTELLEKDSVELANDDVAINKIIEYLKATRVNVREAEASGKRISKKSAVKKAPKKFDKNILDMLVSET